MDDALRFIVPVLTAISLGLVGWCLKSIVQLGERLAVTETRTAANRDDLVQLRKDTSAGIHDLVARIGELSAKVGVVYADTQAIKATCKARNEQASGTGRCSQ